MDVENLVLLVVSQNSFGLSLNLVERQQNAIFNVTVDSLTRPSHIDDSHILVGLKLFLELFRAVEPDVVHLSPRRLPFLNSSLDPADDVIVPDSGESDDTLDLSTFRSEQQQSLGWLDEPSDPQSEGHFQVDLDTSWNEIFDELFRLADINQEYSFLLVFFDLLRSQWIVGAGDNILERKWLRFVHLDVEEEVGGRNWQIRGDSLDKLLLITDLEGVVRFLLVTQKIVCS